MGTLLITLTEANENELRQRNRKHGDISKIVNEALEKYFAST